MTKRTIKVLRVSVILAVAAIVYICSRMANHDYRLVASGKTPHFTFSRIQYCDGGSTMYRGLGYSITAMHRIVPLARPTGQETGTLFRIGPELQYWLPVFGRDGTTTNFIPYRAR